MCVSAEHTFQILATSIFFYQVGDVGVEERVCVYVDDSDKLCRCSPGAIDQPPQAFSFELAGNCSDVEIKNKLLGRNNSTIKKKREWEMWINFGTKDIEFWSELLLRAHSHWFIQTSSSAFQIVANCFSRQTSFHSAQRKQTKQMSEVITVFLEEQLQFWIFYFNHCFYLPQAEQPFFILCCSWKYFLAVFTLMWNLAAVWRMFRQGRQNLISRVVKEK